MRTVLCNADTLSEYTSGKAGHPALDPTPLGEADPMHTTRRRFIAGTAALGTSGLTAQALGARATRAGRLDGEPEGGSFPVTPGDLAVSIVGSSHGNAARVAELLGQDRSLALARIDWGFGDWESALGAASHVGNKEIAELLMGHGARANLFTLAMLDRVDAVRAVCESMPGVEGVRGPHGITLMSHARAGEAERTIEYLTTLGGSDEPEPGTTDPFEGQGRFHGEYRGNGATVRVGDHPRGWLSFVRAGGGSHVLRRHAELEFSPTGAPHVRFRFAAGTDGSIDAVAITGGAVTVDATRFEG